MHLAVVSLSTIPCFLTIFYKILLPVPRRPYWRFVSTVPLPQVQPFLFSYFTSTNSIQKFNSFPAIS